MYVTPGGFCHRSKSLEKFTGLIRYASIYNLHLCCQLNDVYSSYI